MSAKRKPTARDLLSTVRPDPSAEILGDRDDWAEKSESFRVALVLCSKLLMMDGVALTEAGEKASSTMELAEAWIAMTDVLRENAKTARILAKLLDGAASRATIAVYR